MHARRAICLRCRTALASAAACDRCGPRDVCALDEPQGRAKALESSWLERVVLVPRPSSLPGWVAIACVLITAACLLWAREQNEGVFWATLGVCVSASFLAYGMASTHAQRLVETRERSPQGAPLMLMPPDHRARHSGVIVHGSAPEGVVVEAIELHAGGHVMLRDAHSQGFDVALDGGRILHVPSGPVRVVLPEDVRVPLDADAARSWLRDLDPGGDPHPIFPFDRAYALVLRDGDSIAVTAEVEDQAHEPEGGAYRVAPAARQRVQGIAWLEPE